MDLLDFCNFRSWLFSPIYSLCAWVSLFYNQWILITYQKKKILGTFKALYICVHVICTPNSSQSNVIHHIYIYIYIFKIQQRSYLVHKSLTFVRSRLESTDAAPEVPHPRPTRDAASDTVAHVSVRVCVFFFFFFSDSHRLGSIHAKLALIRAKLGWFGQNRGRIGHIRSYRPAADTAETCRKKPKYAEIGLEYGQKSRNLPSSFFFCESRHSNVFFKNILIVKIYRKYK